MISSDKFTIIAEFLFGETTLFNGNKDAGNWRLVNHALKRLIDKIIVIEINEGKPVYPIPCNLRSLVLNVNTLNKKFWNSICERISEKLRNTLEILEINAEVVTWMLPFINLKFLIWNVRNYYNNSFNFYLKALKHLEYLEMAINEDNEWDKFIESVPDTIYSIKINVKDKLNTKAVDLSRFRRLEYVEINDCGDYRVFIKECIIPPKVVKAHFYCDIGSLVFSDYSNLKVLSVKRLESKIPYFPKLEELHLLNSDEYEIDLRTLAVIKYLTITFFQLGWYYVNLYEEMEIVDGFLKTYSCNPLFVSFCKKLKVLDINEDGLYSDCDEQCPLVINLDNDELEEINAHNIYPAYRIDIYGRYPKLEDVNTRAYVRYF